MLLISTFRKYLEGEGRQISVSLRASLVYQGRDSWPAQGYIIMRACLKKKIILKEWKETK